MSDRCFWKKPGAVRRFLDLDGVQWGSSSGRALTPRMLSRAAEPLKFAGHGPCESPEVAVPGAAPPWATWPTPPAPARKRRKRRGGCSGPWRSERGHRGDPGRRRGGNGAPEMDLEKWLLWDSEKIVRSNLDWTVMMLLRVFFSLLTLLATWSMMRKPSLVPEVLRPLRRWHMVNSQPPWSDMPSWSKFQYVLMGKLRWWTRWSTRFWGAHGCPVFRQSHMARSKIHHHYENHLSASARGSFHCQVRVQGNLKLEQSSLISWVLVSGSSHRAGLSFWICDSPKMLHW